MFYDIRSIPKDYLLTFIIGLLVLLGRFIIIRTAAYLMNETQLPIFLVGLRLLAVLESIATLGMSIAIPKYLSKQQDEKAADSYFGASILVSLIGLSMVSCSLVIYSRTFSKIFFGNPDYSNLMVPLSVFLAGTVASVQIYSYYRGHLRFNNANLYRFLHLAFIPWISLIFFSERVSNIWIATGIGLIATSIPILFYASLKINLLFIKEYFYEMFKYGLQRAIANWLYMLLLTLPIFFVANLKHVSTAGNLVIAISIMNVIIYLFALVDVFLLPKVGHAMGDSFKERNLSQFLSKLLGISILLLIILVLLVEIFAPFIGKVLLGDKINNETIMAIRIMVIAAIPLSLFSEFRGIVDAKHARPLNTLYNLIAFALFLLGVIIVYSFNGHWMHLLLSFVVSSYVLGFLVIRETLIMIKQQDYPVKIETVVEEVV